MILSELEKWVIISQKINSESENSITFLGKKEFPIKMSTISWFQNKIHVRMCFSLCDLIFYASALMLFWWLMYWTWFILNLCCSYSLLNENNKKCCSSVSIHKNCPLSCSTESNLYKWRIILWLDWFLCHSYTRTTKYQAVNKTC